jgi:hypothetical protein
VRKKWSEISRAVEKIVLGCHQRQTNLLEAEPTSGMSARDFLDSRIELTTEFIYVPGRGEYG